MNNTDISYPTLAPPTHRSQTGVTHMIDDLKQLRGLEGGKVLRTAAIVSCNMNVSMAEHYQTHLTHIHHVLLV